MFFTFNHNLRKRLKKLLLCLGIFFGVLQASSARLIDPGQTGPEAKFLTSLVHTLDGDGIDIFIGVGGRPPPPVRPRLGPLAGFQPGKTDWSSISKTDWIRAFKKGVTTFVVGYQSDLAGTRLGELKSKCEDSLDQLEINIRVAGCDFVSKWLNTKIDRRVFISFTSADVSYAIRVKNSLEKRGYTAFIFQEGRFSSPWFDATITGELFVQAGHRLVLDSFNARGSAGVALEATCEELLKTGPASSQLSEFLRTNDY